MPLIASVLLPLPLPEAFDYAADEGLGLSVGDQVTVPLGPRLVRGVLTALRDAQGHNRPLKPVEARLDDTPLTEGSLAFLDWAARYAVSPPGDVLSMVLRGLRHPLPRPITGLVLSGQPPTKPTPARLKVLEAASATPQRA